MTKKETVIAAMSGGVDSSVTAALLKKQGYNVIGVTLQFRPCNDEGNVSWCCGRGANESARAVAQQLDIPYYVWDCAKEFEQNVLLPSWREYDAGRTPSPCILCNAAMKFGYLLDKGRKLGATKVATGHYARITSGENPMVQRGLDPKKDQSYFLFSLTPEQVRATLFPLGGLEKTQVRDIASEIGLASAERPDSQDACFVYADGSFSEALRQRFKGERKKGKLLASSGKALGFHNGIHCYTVGQRKGLGVALGQKAYVTQIDGISGNITLSTNPMDLQSTALVASNVCWSSKGPPIFPHNCLVQIRYRSKPAEAEIRVDENNHVHVKFLTPQSAVAPGQGVVFYDGDLLIGGGWIKQAIR